MRDLNWLPAAPADYSAKCRALASGEGEFGLHLQRLSGFRLNGIEALSFRRAMAKAQMAGKDLSPLSAFRLAVVSNATMDFVIDHLPAAAARHGVALEVIETDFDVVMQEALDTTSKVNVSNPDAVLLAVDHRWLGLGLAVDESGTEVEGAVTRLLEAARQFKNNSGGMPILSLLATPGDLLFGSFDRRVAGSLASKIGLVNQSILDFARDEGAYVLDVDAIAQSVGVSEWFDSMKWNAQKQPFAPAFSALYADRLGRLLGAIRGKARKCLVLDLDNTLWGGAVGDEGLDGIVLGQGSAAGEAFLSVQRTAKALKERGVILAVSSKNDDEVARSAFRIHTEMILKENDIAVFQANWTDKSSNLEAIANALNIGIDSLVLLDDNPAERGQVRAALPMVAVPELPADPACFATTLLAAGYFEAVSFSADDVLRAASYAENALRAEVLAKARDLGDYLTSLGMVLRCGPIDASNRTRVTQLMNKSNQFNLLTRRLTENEVESMEADPSMITLQAKLSDRFGDLGLISVATCSIEGANATVTDWLMSCRVLGRKVEEAIYGVLLDILAKRGVRTLNASYLPTKKNSMVSEHFDRLGMTRVKELADGAVFYEASTPGDALQSLPMTIESTL
ncbi:HAD-IIIC family phosphatase [Mesorhizobium sophorae]|uniref:HAD-IIIC family phosphatase n=1 Tax=Mesorhizobium sophorae TaxID=1300294 RepID=UPI00117EB752|nr:HAD-IIIC family phosphatase [Mesorhizobium sophorae]